MTPRDVQFPPQHGRTRMRVCIISARPCAMQWLQMPDTAPGHDAKHGWKALAVHAAGAIPSRLCA
eukprot:14075678-Alexandrium_andersonii.AAC.1